MSISEYFASSYAEARTKFLATARSACAQLTNYVLPDFRGPENEELVTDVARLGAEKPESAFLLISGTHGVEGFCGSGCQIGYLTDRLYEALPSESAVILIHALNPFGFAWLRRVNEVNVDLNRNFQDFRRRLPSSKAYESLHNWLVPGDWDGDQRKKADVELVGYMKKKGFPAFQAAATGGQYTRSNGLFYGGTKETWSNHTLRQIIAKHVATSVKRLAVLDIHSGLGPTGYGEPIYLGPTVPGFDLAKKWYGPEVKSTLRKNRAKSVSSKITGSVANALPPLNSKLKVSCVSLEFGTITPLEVLDALRADNWLHAVPNRVTPLSDGIRRQIRAAFYFDTSWWKAAVYGRFADFTIRAARALK
jgi:hypothetical protein